MAPAAATESKTSGGLAMKNTTPATWKRLSTLPAWIGLGLGLAAILILEQPELGVGVIVAGKLVEMACTRPPRPQIFNDEIDR